MELGSHVHVSINASIAQSVSVTCLNLPFSDALPSAPGQSNSGNNGEQSLSTGHTKEAKARSSAAIDNPSFCGIEGSVAFDSTKLALFKLEDSIMHETEGDCDNGCWTSLGRV